MANPALVPAHRIFVIGGVATLIFIVAYLCFWPVPARPVAWSAPTDAGLVGPFAVNTRLQGLKSMPIGTESGPEHLLIGPDGRLYAAMTSGNLLRMQPDGSRPELFAHTGGRVLGFAFDAHGRLVAADALRGLLAIDPDGHAHVLTDHVRADDPVSYANSVVIAPDGIVYFTDSSRRFAPAAWGGTLQASVLDIMEQSATGRVLAFDPGSGKTRVVAHGLSFANGIALSTDGRSLFVAETGRYRIWKVDVSAHDVDVASGSPQARILIDNLPGYPDNLMRGREGRIWAGLFRPRNAAADGLADRPLVRAVLLRLPGSWLPLGKPYGHVFAFDEQGEIVEDLQDPTGAYPETTGVTETADRLYIHSLHATRIGWLANDRSVDPPAVEPSAVEQIRILRSIREPQAATGSWCMRSRTGFEPFASDGERWFSFWSVAVDATDARVTQARHTRVAALRGCFGPTRDRARQNFFAEISLSGMTLRGSGECLALQIDVPEAGLYPVRCHLMLSDLPAPYVGGLLTTNTITSGAAFGAQSDPPGYTQASIATLRLWKARPQL